MHQWKLMTGRDCDELRMAWVMTYLLPVIATRRFSPRLRTSDNGNRATDAKFVAVAAGHQLPLTHRALTVPQYQILRVLNRLFLYSCSKPEHPLVGDHSCTTGNRSQDLCYDSWSLSHLGYLYPGTTPVMIKLVEDLVTWAICIQGQLLL